MTLQEINEAIKLLPDEGKVSDGYHTFEELYDHRCILWAMIVNTISNKMVTYKSHVHEDGSSYKGWFICGIGEEPGKQVSYHLPDKYWDLVKAPERTPPKFDGHTPADVLERLTGMLTEEAFCNG